MTPLIEGLKKTHGGALAHELFLRNELQPIVDDGRLPPVGEGFSRFLRTPLVTKILDEVVAGELKEGAGDPYDSHPPLRERIAALEGVGHAATELDTRPAIELVTNADEIERALITSKLARPVTPVTWEDVSKLWIERWRKTAAQVARGAGSLTIATVPIDQRALRSLCEDVAGPQTAAQIPEQHIRRWAQEVLGVALCVMLIDAGFAIDTGVGAAVNAVRGEQSIEPIAELGKYLRAEMSAIEWRERWAGLGLADHRFAA